MFDRRKRGKAGRMTLTDLSVQWRGATVLVLGDALLDGWYAGTPRQLCREAPVPVVGLDRITFSCGGAANAAANVAALGGRAVLAAVVGDDSDGARLRTRLREAWVDARLVTVPGRRTVAKRRVMADEQILVRFDQGDTTPLTPAAARELVRTVGDALDAKPDAVIVCDYEAGTVGEEVRQLLRDRRAEVPLLVVDAHDTQPWADVQPDLVTPNFAEALRLLGAHSDQLSVSRPDWVAGAADRLLARAKARAMAVTLDVDGTVVLRENRPAHRTYARPVSARRAPAMPTSPRSRSRSALAPPWRKRPTWPSSPRPWPPARRAAAWVPPSAPPATCSPRPMRATPGCWTPRRSVCR